MQDLDPTIQGADAVILREQGRGTLVGGGLIVSFSAPTYSSSQREAPEQGNRSRAAFHTSGLRAALLIGVFGGKLGFLPCQRCADDLRRHVGAVVKMPQ